MKSEETRMAIFIKSKLKKLDAQTIIDKYHIISKLIFLRIIIPKLMMIRQEFHVKNVIINMFIIKVRTFKPQLYSN